MSLCRPVVAQASQTLARRSFSVSVQERIEEIVEIIKKEKIYDEALMRKELGYVVQELKLPNSYFASFPAKQMADHMLALLSSKMVTRRTGSAMDFHLETPDYAMYCCAMTPELVEKMDENVQRYSRKTKPGYGPTAAFFESAGQIAPDIPNRLGVFLVNRSKYPTVDPPENCTDMKLLAPEEFWTYSPTVQSRYEEILRGKADTLRPYTAVHTRKDGGKIVSIAYNKTARQAGFWRDLSETLDRNNIRATRKFAIRFSNNVLVYTYYLAKETTDNQVASFLQHAALLDVLPNNSLNSLIHEAQFSPNHIAWAHAATMFTFYFGAPHIDEYQNLKKRLANSSDLTVLKTMNRKMHRGPRESYTHEVIHRFPELVSQIYEDFVAKCNGVSVGQMNKALESKIEKTVGDSADKDVLQAFLKFNQHVLKTNFFQPLKSALSFRLNPHFLEGLDYPDIPHGIFLLIGRDFKGFHVRFRDIARGGVRMIRSMSTHAYEHNEQTLFDEVYGLAYTQQKKNKDIPEGGSKGNFLLQYGYQGSGFLSFERYMDAFLDILLPNPHVKDNYGKEEIIFFGPDEGTAEWMDWAALFSKSRGYKIWKSLTTGKSPVIGGVPHDVYGMTTISVHKCVTEVLAKLGWKEENCTKFQTGGPDGDLGSNEIRMSKDKTIGVVDGSGVVFDPDGLNRGELGRLAKLRKMVNIFDTSKLGPKGYKVLVTDKNVKLPNGETVDDGTIFRNTFHLRSDVKADLFVPCGGRPEAVNASNVHMMFLPDGSPKFKVIVEGANLFITEDARLVLEKAGVILHKDATANKGGVTSSSCEVLAGLALSDEEHQRLMCQDKTGNLPEFYQKYAQEIQVKVAGNAKAEFDCMWKEHERTGTPRTLLTNILSDKINRMDDYIRATRMFDNQKTRDAVFKKALPQTLLQKVGLPTIYQRVPEAYQRAIFSNYIASHYVYKYGLEANEVGFFEFMKELLE